MFIESRQSGGINPVQYTHLKDQRKRQSLTVHTSVAQRSGWPKRSRTDEVSCFTQTSTPSANWASQITTVFHFLVEEKGSEMAVSPHDASQPGYQIITQYQQHKDGMIHSSHPKVRKTHTDSQPKLGLYGKNRFRMLLVQVLRLARCGSPRKHGCLPW